MTDNTSSSVYICSVARVPMRTKPMGHFRVDADGNQSGDQPYVIEAADQDKGYAILEVTPCTQWVLDPSYTEGHRQAPRHTTAKEIADALIGLWRQQIGAEAGGPGVDLIAGPEPTEDELAVLHGRHEAWSRWLINHADSLQIHGKQQEITDTHRGAAEYLGLAHSPDHEWVKILGRGSHVECPSCGDPIKAHVAACGKCGDLVEWTRKYGFTPDQVEVEMELPTVANLRRRTDEPEVAEAA